MSLLLNEEPRTSSEFEANEHSQILNELTLITKNEYSQKNAASKNQKEKAQQSEVRLNELLKSTLKKKGEYNEENIKWKGHDTVEISNVSNLAIHSFVLLAEALGKNITYNKQTVIKISN